MVDICMIGSVPIHTVGLDQEGLEAGLSRHHGWSTGQGALRLLLFQGPTGLPGGQGKGWGVPGDDAS